MEAQKNYLQYQARQLPLHDDLITTDISSITTDDVSPTPPTTTTNNNTNDDSSVGRGSPTTFTVADYYHSSAFIIPDTGELRDDFRFNVDTASYVEELGCCPLKAKSTKKQQPASKANSKQSSRNTSRQSSRTSRAGNHCSIEDLEASEVDGEGEGAGSQWGGSSNISNRSNSFVDRNANLKKAGLSIIHVGGTTSDPAFEMIVPYDEAFEEVGVVCV